MNRITRMSLFAITLFALTFCTGLALAENVKFTSRSTSEGTVELQPGLTDAIRGAVADELSKGVTVKVKPEGLGGVNQGIADLQEMVDALQDAVADAHDAATRNDATTMETLSRIEQKLDSRKSDFPWWGWLLVILALLLALYRSHDGRDGRDGRDGKDAEIDEYDVRRVVHKVLAEQGLPETPNQALVFIRVGDAGDGSTVNVGNIAITTREGDDNVPTNAIDIKVVNTGDVTMGQITVKRDKPATLPATPQA